MSNNIAVNTAKLIIIDLFWNFLYWPLWWYSRGLYNSAVFCLNEIKDQEERLGLSVWIKNLFTPMYGQYDIEGRIISFFVRLVQIIFRLFLLLIWSVMVLLLLAVWVLLPPAVIYAIVINLYS